MTEYDRKSPRRTVTSLNIGLALVLALPLVYLAVSCDSEQGLEIAVANLVRKSQLATNMRVGLFKAVEAEKSAVLAVTDQDSLSFARQARENTEAVEKARAELARRIEKDNIPEEVTIFKEFGPCWSRFREVDQTLLDLAVQNTNLKAFDLSFGPAAEALTRFQTGLTQIMGKYAATDQCMVARLAGRALAAGLGIQMRHAPHIAEAADDKMDRIEVEIAALQKQVADQMVELDGRLPEEGKALLAQASEAFRQHVQYTREILRLSRQNSNIRSLIMSLSQKRKISAQCEDILNALQEAIQSHQFKATR